MTETLACPGCNAQLTLPGLPQGQSVQCPRCRHVFVPSFKPVVPALRASPISAPEIPEEESSPHLHLMRQQPLRGQGKALLAKVLLTLSMLSFAGQFFVDYQYIRLLEQQMMLPIFILGDPPPEVIEFHKHLAPFEKNAALLALLNVFICLAAIVTFLMWLNQASRNLCYLEVEGLRHNSVQAVVAFFIPVANFIWPCVIVQEIWRASDPEITHSWRESPASKRIRCWWLLLLTAAGLGVLSGFMETDAHFDPHGMQNAYMVLCVADVGMAVAILLQVLLVHRISQRQTQRYIRLYKDPA